MSQALLEPYLGIWEGENVPMVVTVLDHDEAVRVHTRVRADDQVFEDDLVLPVVIEGGRLVLEGDAGQSTLHREGDQLVLEVPLGDGRQAVVLTRSSTKQVMVYRRDLQMRKGKIAAQCAHGSMAVFFRRDQSRQGALNIPMDGPMEHWARARFAKIVLSADDESSLLQIHEAALAAGLPTVVITDAGHTEFHGVPTRTVVAIGPAAVGEIDRITGPGGLVACKLA